MLPLPQALHHDPDPALCHFIRTGEKQGQGVCGDNHLRWAHTRAGGCAPLGFPMASRGKAYVQVSL